MICEELAKIDHQYVAATRHIVPGLAIDLIAARHVAPGLALRRYDNVEHEVEQIKVNGHAKMPSGGVIRAWGYGSRKRLPGFDDGGNYKENRRVEVRLIVGDESDSDDETPW